MKHLSRQTPFAGIFCKISFMSDLDLAKKHLATDPVLKKIIAKYSIKEYWGGQPNYFLDLAEIVTGQQLSMKAADTIYKRFLKLFNTDKPTPKQVLQLSIEQLRSVGLSNSKANYIQNIARAVKQGNLNLEYDILTKLTNEQITNQLTAVRGLGPWSAEMFLMFSLKRPDIFSIGDLGVRTAISRLYSVDRNDHAKILEISINWQPYRTFACRYLWSSLDNT